MTAFTSNLQDASEGQGNTVDAPVGVEAKSTARNSSNDEQILAHFGKRQQYRRNFGLVSILGLGCTLSTLEMLTVSSNAAH
jgi:hypothetical protein